MCERPSARSGRAIRSNTVVSGDATSTAAPPRASVRTRRRSRSGRVTNTSGHEPRRRLRSRAVVITWRSHQPKCAAPYIAAALRYPKQ